MTNRKRDYILILIIGALAFLEMVAIHREVLFDEALSIYSARQPLKELLSFTLRSADAQPPLFAFLLHFLLKISYSEIWLRAFSLLCSLLIAFTVYKLAKLIFGDFVGLLACSLTAFSEPLIFYTTQIRSYGIWILCSVASAYFFLKALESSSLKNIFLYIIATTLSIYFHYYGLGVLSVEAIFFFFYRTYLKLKFKSWLIIWASISFLLIPQAIHALLKFQKFYMWGEYFKRPPTTFKDLYYLFNEYSGHVIISAVFFVIIAKPAISKLLTFLSGKKMLRRTKFVLQYLRSNYRITFALLFFSLPVCASFFISIFNFRRYVFFEPRYLFPFMLIYFFIVGWAVSTYGRMKNYLALFIVLLTLLNALRFSEVLYHKKPHIQLRSAADFIRTRLRNDDVIAVSNVHRFLSIFNYLKRPLLIIVRRQDTEKCYLLKIFEFKNDEIMDNLNSLNNKKRLWIVTENGEDNAVKWLAENKYLKLQRDECVGGINIRLYLIDERLFS